jgi:hypothetical protein
MAVANDWVLRKRGMFYRPKARGYTSSIAEAARLTEADARSYASQADGVTAHPASDFEPKPDKIMTRDEYLAANLQGWHQVCWNVDGHGGVGVRYMSAFDPDGDMPSELQEEAELLGLDRPQSH